MARQEYLNRKNAIDATALRLFLHGTEQIWNALVLIASGEFTEPTRLRAGMLKIPNEDRDRKMWDFLAVRFNDASPDEPFDIKAAKKILRKWSALLNRDIEWEGK